MPYIELRLDDGKSQKITQKPDWTITFNEMSMGEHTIYVHAVEDKIKGPDVSVNFIASPIPQGVTASDGTYIDKIRITWNSVTGAEKYYIYRSLSAGSGYVEIINVVSTSYDDIAVGAGTNYYYKIKAWSIAIGGSPYSDYDIGTKFDPIPSVSKKEMVSVLEGTFTQEDTVAKSFSHTITGFNMGKYEVTYEFWYEVYTWAVANGYYFANVGKEGHDGTAGINPLQFHCTQA